MASYDFLNSSEGFADNIDALATYIFPASSAAFAENINTASVLPPMADGEPERPPHNYVPPAYGLMRQIGEHKWWAGVPCLEDSTDIDEIEVASYYTGWKWILRRTEKKYIYTQNTYWNDDLVASTIMNTSPLAAEDSVLSAAAAAYEEKYHNSYVYTDGAPTDAAKIPSLAATAAENSEVSNCNCDDCKRYEDETETDQADEEYKESDDRSEQVHYCKDPDCNWDCGVLWCGCIDVCRGRCGNKDSEW